MSDLNKCINRVRADGTVFLNSNLQLFDLKHMAEMETFYRRICLGCIRAYKIWRQNYISQTDTVELLYGSLEGIMLRCEAENAAKLYWIIRQDFRSAWNSYISRLSNYPSRRYVSSD